MQPALLLLLLLLLTLGAVDLLESWKLCPSTKSAVTPLEACSDPKFFRQRVGDQCCLKTEHEYYAQVQGQLAITGAAWCDFIVYMIKGMSIERITFDQQFWDKLSQKLEANYFQHFIYFAASEYKTQQHGSSPTRS